MRLGTILKILLISSIASTAYAVTEKDTIVPLNQKLTSGISFTYGEIQLDDGLDRWRADGINWDSVEPEIISDRTTVSSAPGDFLMFSDIDDSDAIRKATISDIVLAGGGANSGWTDDGTTVRLTTSTDNVSVGADVEPNSEKLQITGSTRTTGEFIEGTDSTASAGGFGLVHSTKTTSFTADDGATVYLCDATSGNITATLPTAASADTRVYYIKKIDSSVNIVTIDGDSSETIDDSTTQVISFQYDSAEIISDGSEWWII